MKTAYGDTPTNAKTRIRAVRKLKGLTIDELAERVGVSPQAIQRWETQTRSISVERLLDVANALGVPSADLLPDSPKLSLDEQEMLDWYRGASQAERRAMASLRLGFNESRKHDFQSRRVS